MAKQALEGLKVVDFGWVIAGPLAMRYLAHHGATVVRVESSRRVDITRMSLPYKGSPGVNTCAMYDSYNSNKLGMALNLSHPKGLEVARRLVAWADIVGESYAPGVMDGLGLGYEELKKVKPDVIMYSSTNLGHTGPEATQPGFGTQLVSYAGFTHLTGWPDRPPTQPYGVYTDFFPYFLVTPLLAAIEYRRRTGRGQYLDLSQMEASIHFMAPAIMSFTVNGRLETRDGNRSPYAAPHGAYPCQGEDRWCAIDVFNDEEWKALCGVMGDPDWAKEPGFATLLSRKDNEEDLNRRLGEWTCGLAAEEVMEKLQAAGVPAGIVKKSPEVLDDPQLAYRHYFWELDHAEIGMHHYEGAGFTLSKTPAEIKMPSPLLGEHTEYVCREILGMRDDEFVELLNQGVFQ